MFYLILAIASSALISIMMRQSEKFVKNKMVMFTANYAVCIAMARWFMGEIQLLTSQEGIAVAVILGVLCGILYLANFVLLQKSMRFNGIVLSSTFMKLGVVVPTLMAILIFKERPGIWQVCGILLAVIAIIMIQFEKEQAEGTARTGFLLLLLMMSGITDSMANIYDKAGSAALKDHYLFYTFFAALVLAGILAVKDRKNVSRWDIIFGVLIGIPNYLSARFLLLSLAHVPAVITYPVYSVGTIVAVSAAGLLIFREKISKRKAMALGVILISMVMLNL